MKKEIETIGIAGKSCSGKNLVAALLEEYGFFPIDLDLLGHQALEKEVEKVKKEFKVAIPWIESPSPQGEEKKKLDRSELAKVVFKDPQKLAKLEAILYPTIGKKIEELFLQKKKRSLNGAKLLESQWIEKCDLIFWVKAPFFQRVYRGRKRDHLPLLALLRRFWGQKKLSAQPFKKVADIKTVYNWGSEKRLKKQIQRILIDFTAGEKPHEKLKC